MLQIDNSEELADIGKATYHCEKFLCEILSSFFAQSVSVERSGSPLSEISGVSDDWFLLRSTDNFEIGLDLKALFGIKNSSDYYTHTALFASQLLQSYSGKGAEMRFNIVDPLSQSSKFVFHRYNIYSQKRALLAAINAAFPENISPYHDACGDLLTESDLISPAHVPGKVKLTLGAVSLDLQEFLNLRSGMKIESKLPQQFESELSIGDEIIAKTRVKLNTDKLEIEII